MTGPEPALDVLLVVEREAVRPTTLADIAATAAALAEVDRSDHIARYPAFTKRLRGAGVDATAIPSLARDVVETAGRTLVPSAADRELRLAAMQEFDWQDIAPEDLADAAEADPEAFHQFGCRLLGMAAWQDVDLATAGDPLSIFERVQARHREFLSSLGWTPPERAIPDARDALASDQSLQTTVLTPADGLVVWEAEELIEMDLTFLAQLGDDRTTVGVYVEHAAMRRPYAETHHLRPALETAGTDIIHYDELNESPAGETGGAASPTPRGETTDEHVAWPGALQMGGQEQEGQR